MKILINKYIGNLGAKILIENLKKELLNRFSENYIDNVYDAINKNIKENETSKKLLNKLKSDKIIEDYEEVGYGGFLSSLWKISDRNKVGIEYNLKKVLLNQGIVEICDYYNLDIYRFLTKNVHIVFVSNENKTIFEDLIDGFFSIGETNNKKQRLRVDGETESFLTKSFRDDIEKIINVKKLKLI